MSTHHYVIFAYVIGLGMLWGYAVVLWLAGRNLARREQTERGKS